MRRRSKHHERFNRDAKPWLPTEAIVESHHGLEHPAGADTARGMDGRGLQHHGADWSEDGTRILTLGYDRAARLWNTKTGRLLRAKTFDRTLAAGALSPNGRRLATTDPDHRGAVWDPSTGTRVTELDRSQQMKMGDHSIILSPDGHWTVTVGRDNMIGIWKTATGKLHKAITAHKKHLADPGRVRFTKDGSQLITVSADELNVWEAESFNSVQRIKPQAGKFERFSISDDGLRLGLALDTGEVWIFGPTDAAVAP